MNIAQAIHAAAQRLSATSDTARLDAELLMAHALACTRSALLLRHMTDPVPAAYAALIDRRATHEPVAYITGTQEFWGLPLRVTRDTLIPRGDSETIVETALAAAPAPARVLDCGTGTGALLLATLSERPQAQGIGIDASPAALAIAAANAAALGLSARAQMRLADWTQPDWATPLGQFDLILSNPPYVESEAPLAPSVRAYEPASALFAGPDGLDDYRRLIPQLPALLTPGGIVVVEIGHTQAESVAAIAQQAGFTAQLHRDLAGRPRALLFSR